MEPDQRRGAEDAEERKEKTSSQRTSALSAPLRSVWDRRTIVRPAGARARSTRRWRELAERRALAGLTTRGTTPKRRLESRLIRAAVDALAVALGQCFHELPPAAQARALELEHHLSAVRRQLL